MTPVTTLWDMVRMVWDDSSDGRWQKRRKFAGINDRDGTWRGYRSPTPAASAAETAGRSCGSWPGGWGEVVRRFGAQQLLRVGAGMPGSHALSSQDAR